MGEWRPKEGFCWVDSEGFCTFCQVIGIQASID